MLQSLRVPADCLFGYSFSDASSDAKREGAYSLLPLSLRSLKVFFDYRVLIRDRRSLEAQSEITWLDEMVSCKVSRLPYLEQIEAEKRIMHGIHKAISCHCPIDYRRRPARLESVSQSSVGSVRLSGCTMWTASEEHLNLLAAPSAISHPIRLWRSLQAATYRWV